MPSIGILGGGPAGLVAAYRLAKAGHSVRLYEAAPVLGGLARSFELGDATIERYYHFLCGIDHGYFRLLDELDLASALRWRPTRMGYFYRGRLYPFSSSADLLRFGGMSMVSRLRYGLAMLYASRLERWRRLDPLFAEPWLIRLLGEEGYRVTWHPLLARKFPGVHHEISAAWVWHRIHRVARSRKTLFHQERLGYLAGGTQTLIDRLTERLEALGVTVDLERPVDRIEVDRIPAEDGGEALRATGVRAADGEVHAYDHVLSAVPLPVYNRLLAHVDHPQLDMLRTHRYLAVVCVTLRLSRSISENFWTNVEDERIPFNGVIEYTRLNPEITPDGSTIVYVPFYLPRDDPRMALDDASLVDETFEALEHVQPALRRSDLLEAAVSRDPYAQVICSAGFLERVPPHRTPIDGLHLVESSQLYPSDRTISGTIDLAEAAAAEVLRALDPLEGPAS